MRFSIKNILIRKKNYNYLLKKMNITFDNMKIIYLVDGITISLSYRLIKINYRFFLQTYALLNTFATDIK